ncbi:hypothetical protein YC2023_019449 [Brassica napus]
MVLKTSGRNFIVYTIRPLAHHFPNKRNSSPTAYKRHLPRSNLKARDGDTDRSHHLRPSVDQPRDGASRHAGMDHRTNLAAGKVTILLLLPRSCLNPLLVGFLQNIKSFTNQQTRLIQHDVSIVKEDDLDSRWEEATGEVVDEVIFLSRHTAASNRPALTVHPIGVLHLKEGESPPHGGKAGWAALPSPRIGPWLRLLKKMAEAHSLVPEFEITLEGTHHGPITSKPTMFLEIGRLGLGGGEAVGNWNSETGKRTVLLGIGGGHYAPRHVDVVLKDDIWVGHLLSGYSLPMEEAKPGENHIGGTWRQSIQAAFEATKASFPGGEILAHLDQKSFKGWQKKAITEFLAEQNINVGRPNDFT